MNNKRPVNLDLGSLKYPPMAIVSILHRLSGLVLFLLLPVILYFFDLSLRSEASFEQLHTTVLAGSISKMVVWAFSTALIYHILAGIRHILMDMGYGEELSAGRQSAVSVLVLAIILTVLLGVWIW